MSGHHLDKSGNVSEPFAKLLVGLAEAFGTTLTEQRIRIYARALGDIDIDALKIAALAVVRSSKYFPTVSELRRHVEPSEDDAALIAWTGLLLAAVKVGAYMSLDVEDVSAAAALTAVFGSWAEFCGQSDVALASQRASFLASHRQSRRILAQERSSTTGPVRLAGLCESSGQYPSGAAASHVWAARLTADGDVVLAPERPRLEEAPALKQLTSSEE